MMTDIFAILWFAYIILITTRYFIIRRRRREVQRLEDELFN